MLSGERRPACVFLYQRTGHIDRRIEETKTRVHAKMWEVDHERMYVYTWLTDSHRIITGRGSDRSHFR